ncbi:MAG: hypothetical protein M3Z16_12315, partial [Pseudomonadota bacterium]|nr:hypothetical protein [Pseudomonadota bacterium]
MNNSSGDGQTRQPDAKSGRDETESDEWAATRSAAPTREEIDEWQATRVQVRAPGDEWQQARVQPRPSGEDRPARSQAHAAREFNEAAGWRGANESPDAWAATRAQTALATQILGSEDDYLASEKNEIGRQIGGNERELFVSCGPAEAMQQQFEHLRPEFIAVHDIATASSRKLMAGIAAASGRPVQRLVIRRQGYGTALATLEFVELTTTDNHPLRLYTTEVDADTANRHALAKTLLSFSRLAVVMVGELPGHAIAAALKPLHDDIIAGPWPNRNILLLPLASASTLVTHGLDLGRGTGVAVRTTPQVARPADAWAFVTGTWSRLREQSAPDGRNVPELGAFRPPAYQARRTPLTTGMPSGDTLSMEDGAPPVQLTMRPMPSIFGARPGPGEGTVVERYVRQVSELNGVMSCCAFDIQSGEPVAYAGATPSGAELAAQGSLLVTAMLGASRSLGFGAAMPETAISLGSHHLLLRGIPRHPG